MRGGKSEVTGELRKNRYHQDYSTIKIGKNIPKKPGDQKRFPVTQTPEKVPPANAEVNNLQREK